MKSFSTFDSSSFGEVLSAMLIEQGWVQFNGAGNLTAIFISAKSIIDGIVTSEMIRNFQSNGTKVIAISGMTEYLVQVSPMVDATCSKIDLSDYDKLTQVLSLF